MAICVRGNFRCGHFCHANLVTRFYDSSSTNYIFVPFLYIWGKALSRNIRELKQQRRRRLQKRHLKSEFALLQTLSRLFHLVYFVKCWQMFWSWILKDCIKGQGKKRKLLSCVPVLDKTWIQALWRCSRTTTAKNVQKKRDARAKLLLFCRSRCRPRRRCLS